MIIKLGTLVLEPIRQRSFRIHVQTCKSVEVAASARFADKKIEE